jgi:arginine/ornithine N-succinyltransferase beta subunit
VTGIEDREDGELALIAVGTLADYRCCIGLVGGGESGVTINSEAADLLSIAAGDTVTWAPA